MHVYGGHITRNFTFCRVPYEIGLHGERGTTRASKGRDVSLDMRLQVALKTERSAA